MLPDTRLKVNRNAILGGGFLLISCHFHRSLGAKRMQFLSATWEHLLIANYAVHPTVLVPFVPNGTALDPFEGVHYVSLVAFMFRNTRILGVRVPFHVNFEEVNLRFYVRPRSDPAKRAVTFIKEIVPRQAIALVANTLFHENYACRPMKHEHEPGQYSYSWYWDGKWQSFSASVTEPLTLPHTGSLHEFITEHYWGYTQAGARTLEYAVKHEQWRTCDVHSFRIEVDFASTYGKEFAFLSEVAPLSTCYALGSPVIVMKPRHFK